MESAADRVACIVRSRGKKRFCLAVDGVCGSGKTTFCEMLGEKLGANVVHTDNFYLPFDKRRENWREVSGGNMDFEKLKTCVLEPFLRGESFKFDSFDHRNPEQFVNYSYPDRDILIVEGSYSLFPSVSGFYDLKIYLTCSESKQAERIRRREGDNFPIFEALWIPKEKKYNLEYGIEKGADLVIDTTDMF